MKDRFEIVDDDKASRANFLACARVTSPLHLLDNLIGVCSHCGAAIQYRPNAPKEPIKICVQCVPSDAIDMQITQTTAAELRTLALKKKSD